MALLVAIFLHLPLIRTLPMRRSLLFLLVVLSLRSHAAENVVVWDFASRDGEKDKTTESLTYEFEEALSENSSYDVLGRRKLDRLQAVIKNEKALQDIGELTAGGSTELRRRRVSCGLWRGLRRRR